ncbi:MAG: AI-2E family transporter [Gemmatimonadetes bacterium]|nr:AI-2E family transporter [Gemmatimonadota bacterium]
MTDPRESAPPTLAPPSRKKTAELRSLSVTGLFILAVFYTLHLARDLFLPIVLALFLTLLLQPPVRWLRRLRLSAHVAPAVVLLALVGGVVVGGYQLWVPASEWIARAPQDLAQLEGKVRKLLRSVERVSKTAERVDQITEVGPTSDAPKVEIQEATLSETVLGGAWHGLAAGVIVLVLCYFFLSTGSAFVRKLPRVLPRPRAERIITIVAEAEDQISKYLISVTLINLTFGVITAAIMFLTGMPTPVLLGAVAMVLNFIPYLGPITMLTLVALVGLISLPKPELVLTPMALYLVLHALESNFVTPHLLGRRLPLNPLVIFLSFLFWWWIWGVPGAILAVPIMVTFKIIADHTPGMEGVGEFLGR